MKLSLLVLTILLWNIYSLNNKVLAQEKDTIIPVYNIDKHNREFMKYDSLTVIGRFFYKVGYKEDFTQNFNKYKKDFLIFVEGSKWTKEFSTERYSEDRQKIKSIYFKYLSGYYTFNLDRNQSITEIKFKILKTKTRGVDSYFYMKNGTYIEKNNLAYLTHLKKDGEYTLANYNLISQKYPDKAVLKKKESYIERLSIIVSEYKYTDSQISNAKQAYVQFLKSHLIPKENFVPEQSGNRHELNGIVQNEFRDTVKSLVYSVYSNINTEKLTYYLNQEVFSSYWGSRFALDANNEKSKKLLTEFYSKKYPWSYPVSTSGAMGVHYFAAPIPQINNVFPIYRSECKFDIDFIYESLNLKVMVGKKKIVSFSVKQKNGYWLKIENDQYLHDKYASFIHETAEKDKKGQNIKGNYMLYAFYLESEGEVLQDVKVLKNIK